MQSQHRKLLLKLVGTLVLVVFVLLIVDVTAVLGLVLALERGTVVWSLCVLLIRQYLIALRWFLIACKEPSFKKLHQYFYFVMASTPLNLVGPGLVGFDVARGVMLARSEGTDRSFYLSSVVVDRLFGLISLLVLGVVGCIILSDLPASRTYLLLLISLLLAVVLALTLAVFVGRSEKILRWCLVRGAIGRLQASSFQTLGDSLKQFVGRRFQLSLAFTISLLVHLCAFLVVWFIGLGLELQNVGFLLLGAVSSIVWVVVILPISMFGLGMSELSYVYLLSLRGVSAEVATALSLQFFTLNVLLAILCAPVLLWTILGRDSLKLRSEDATHELGTLS